MTCEKCVDTVRNSLKDVKGVKSIDISLEKGNIVVETDLPYSVIQEKIEQSGKKAVLKGYGGNTQIYVILQNMMIFNYIIIADNSGAVAMLGGNSGYSIGNKIMGVVRFAQTPDGCIIDGTVDGLTPGEHGIHVHECGDISSGCDK